MKRKTLIEEVNNAIHKQYGIIPKCILMNRNDFDSLKKELNKAEIETMSFFGIHIHIDNTIEKVQFNFYVNKV